MKNSIFEFDPAKEWRIDVHKIARFRGVRTANTPIFALFVCQHGAYKTELVSSDSTLSLNRFGPLWRIEFVKLPPFNYDP